LSHRLPRVDVAQLRISKVCASISTARTFLCNRGASRTITSHHRHSGALATTNGTSRIFHKAHLCRDYRVIMENSVTIYLHRLYTTVYLVQHVVHDHTARESFAMVRGLFAGGGCSAAARPPRRSEGGAYGRPVVNAPRMRAAFGMQFLPPGAAHCGRPGGKAFQRRPPNRRAAFYRLRSIYHGSTEPPGARIAADG
jgi:hypothetical protein